MFILKDSVYKSITYRNTFEPSRVLLWPFLRCIDDLLIIREHQKSLMVSIDDEKLLNMMPNEKCTKNFEGEACGLEKLQMLLFEGHKNISLYYL